MSDAKWFDARSIRIIPPNYKELWKLTPQQRWKLKSHVRRWIKRNGMEYPYIMPGVFGTYCGPLILVEDPRYPTLTDKTKEILKKKYPVRFGE